VVKTAIKAFLCLYKIPAPRIGEVSENAIKYLWDDFAGEKSFLSVDMIDGVFYCVFYISSIYPFNIRVIESDYERAIAAFLIETYDGIIKRKYDC
jgi:hypothetical protein